MREPGWRRDLGRIEAMAETKPVRGPRMLASAVTLIVRVCARVPWLIIVLGLAAAAASAVYSARHFAINTDVNKLISPDLDWRKRELEFETLFPGHFGSTLVVVDAPTAELAAQASADLTRRLGGAAGVVHFGRGHGRQRVLLAQRPVVSPSRRRRAPDARPAPGRAADRHAGRRSEPARADAGAVAGVHRRAKPLDHARRLGAAAVDGGDDLRGRSRRTPRRVLLAGIARRPSAGDQRLAAADRSASGAGLFGAAAGQALERRHPPGRQGPRSLGQVPRARAADRLGADGRRGVRHRAAGRAGQRPRHRRRRAGDPVARLEVGAHHRRGVHQSVRRPEHHRRARPDDGRRAEHDLGRLRRAVRRPRRRLRHPVFGPLPRGTPRHRRTASGAGAGGGQGRRAADARRRRGRRRLHVVHADRLPRRLRIGPDRRRRHAGRLCHQHHAAAGLAGGDEPAGRSASGRLSRSGAGRPVPADLPRAGDRRHRGRRLARLAAALSPHLRLRSDPSAQQRDRVDLHAARPRQRSARRHQFGQRGAAVARRRQYGG